MGERQLEGAPTRSAASKGSTTSMGPLRDAVEELGVAWTLGKKAIIRAPRWQANPGGRERTSAGEPGRRVRAPWQRAGEGALWRDSPPSFRPGGRAHEGCHDHRALPGAVRHD